VEVAIKKLILAAVTTEKGKIRGVPVFYAKDEDEKEIMALTLSRVLEAVAHELANGIYILVKH
jgi:hypothetical protein